MKAKKTMAGVLAVSLLAVSALVTLPASAAETVTLSASNETVSAAGDSFTVSVSLTGVPSTKVNTMDFALTYDTSVLTINSVAIGSAANTSAVTGDSTASDAPVFNYNIANGEVAISWTTGLDSSAWIASDGVILTLSGKVNSGVADGTVTPINIGPVTRETYDGSGVYNSSLIIGAVDGTSVTEYTVNTVSGSVTVKGSSSGGSSSSASEASLLGDVNLDGSVTMADVVTLGKSLTGNMTLLDEAIANADCYQGDGATEPNSQDMFTLVDFQLGAVTSLPQYA